MAAPPGSFGFFWKQTEQKTPHICTVYRQRILQCFCSLVKAVPKLYIFFFIRTLPHFLEKVSLGEFILLERETICSPSHNNSLVNLSHPVNQIGGRFNTSAREPFFLHAVSGMSGFYGMHGHKEW